MVTCVFAPNAFDNKSINPFLWQPKSEARQQEAQFDYLPKERSPDKFECKIGGQPAMAADYP